MSSVFAFVCNLKKNNEVEVRKLNWFAESVTDVGALMSMCVGVHQKEVDDEIRKLNCSAESVTAVGTKRIYVRQQFSKSIKEEW